MTILYINTGTSANAGNGDSLRTAFTKINDNFSYLETVVGGGGGGGTGTGITAADLGDFVITNNILSTTNTNQDILLNPNGAGKVRLINTTLQFDNGINSKSTTHLLNTKLTGTPVGLGVDNINASLRIVGDKETLGTLVDMGMYTGSLGSWESKVRVDYQGNLFVSKNLQVNGTIDAQSKITSQGDIQAIGDVYGSYVIANYGFKFADGTTQLTAVNTVTATETRLGSIIVGQGLEVENDGTLNLAFTATVATTSSLGFVQIGNGLGITPTGELFIANLGAGDIVTTGTVATTSSLGLVQIGFGLAVTPEGILSVDNTGLENIRVNNTTLYPVDPNYLIQFSNKDIESESVLGASFISIPALTDSINDMRISSHGVMLITTEPDLENGIVIAPGVDGFGPGYVAIGASGTENTSGMFIFANTSQINMWPNEVIAELNTGDPDVGVLDLFTFDNGYISLRPDNTATVIVKGGGVHIKTGGLRFPDGTYMATAAATGVVSFNNTAGAVTFTGTDIINQLGYTPYDGDTNSLGFLTSAVTTFNGASGDITFTATDVIAQLGYTPYDEANPSGYLNSAVITFNGQTGTVTFTATDIAAQLGYTPYDAVTNSSNFFTTASLTNISGDVIPSEDSLFDLGTSSTQWRSLYVSSSTLYIGGVPVTVNGAGQLTVDGLNVSTSGYDQGLNTTDDVGFNSVTTNAITFADGSTQTTAVFEVPLAEPQQLGIVYAKTSATSTLLTALGYNAGLSNTTGDYNVAIGYNALRCNTIGSYNHAIGYNALELNSEGNDNVAIGYNTLKATTLGSNNIAVGSCVLADNITGSNNIGIGYFALQQNCGLSNVAVGTNALQSNALGYGNIAIGDNSLRCNSLGSTNIAVGYDALYENTTGIDNIAIGQAALLSNTYGSYNIAFGYQSMCFNASGDSNIAIGKLALYCNIDGRFNVAIGECTMRCSSGYGASNVAIGDRAMGYGSGGGTANVAIGWGSLGYNTFGYNNVAIGEGALLENTTGANNIAIGFSALQCNTSGLCNVAIGAEAMKCNAHGRHNIALGNLALCGNLSGCHNIALGQCSMTANISGCSNIALGFSSLKTNNFGRWNVAIGECALLSNTSGYQNVAVGRWAMRCNVTGWNNVALGYHALGCGTTGCDNVAIGLNAGLKLSSSSHIAIGANALPNLVAGSCNVVIGINAACFSTSTLANTVVGSEALLCNITGSCNLALGFNAGRCITGSGNVVIGSNSGTAILTSNCNVLISDGGGNVKVLFTGTGAVAWGGSADFGTSGYVLQSNGNGTAPSWVNAGTLTSGIANTATNLQSGTAGQIPYQTGPSQTSFFGPGTAGQILVSAGSTSTGPTYTNTASIQVGFATNILGGSTGSLAYQSGSGATDFITGTAGQLLVSGGAGAPAYTNTTSIQVGFSTNVLGGDAGGIVYQTGSAASAFLTLGTEGQVLVAGASAPAYTNTSTLQVGFATNVLGGSAGQVHYQSTSGVTAFVTNGTSGDVFVSSGAGAPRYQNTLTLAGTTVATTTQTGALVVAGGVGIGGKLFVGGNIDTDQIALNSTAASTNTNVDNALYVAGGAWIGGSTVIRGDAIFDGVVVFNSSTITTVNQSVATSTNFIQLHAPTTATWAFNDGKDIGIIFNYYSGGDNNAFLGRSIDTGYLEWKESGTDGSSVFTGTYGTFRTGNIQLASGTANLGNTNTGALVVTGGVGISGNLFVGGNIVGTVTRANNLSAGAAGSIPYNTGSGVTTFLSLGTAGTVLTAGANAPQWTSFNSILVNSATIATNLIGGTAGQIPYQLTTSSTAFFGPGTVGQILVSAGANTPVYTNTGSIFVGFSKNLTDGTAGSIVYQSSTSTTAFLGLGTNGFVLTAGGSAPQWTSLATLSAGNSTTATNIANGNVGQLVFQTGIGKTSFVGTGTAGQILVSAGSTSTGPTFTTTSSIQVGFAGNLLGGSTGSVAYQNASGSTAFISGTAGQLLQFNGSSNPTAVSTTSLQVGAAINIIGGTTGGIPYQTNTTTTAILPIGTQGQVLTVNAASDAPVWTSVGSLSAGIATTATNLAAGTAGQIPYQSSAGVTAFVGGTNGQIFVSGGVGTPSFLSTATFWVGGANTAVHVIGTQTGALLYQTGTNQTGRLALGNQGDMLIVGQTGPQWTSTATLAIAQAGSANNLNGGTAGAIVYQSGVGATAFSAAGTSGQVLLSGGAGAPSYSSTINSITLATPTVTGAIAYNQAVGTTVNTSAVTVDSWSTSTYRSAKYVISISNTSTSEFQTTEALVVHNNTNAFIKSDSVFSGAFSLMAFTASVSAGNVLVQGTGVSNNNIVKVHRVYISV